MCKRETIQKKQTEAFSKKMVINLPKIDNTKKNQITNVHSVPTTQRPTADGLRGQKLPTVKNKAGVSTISNATKRPPAKTDNPVLKQLIQNPMRHTPRLNDLINTVVQASKQLLGSSEDNEGAESKREVNSLKITGAYHSRKEKISERKIEEHKVKSTGPNQRTGDLPQPSATKVHPSTTPNEDNSNSKLSFKPPPDVTEFLSGLPQDSHEEMVKCWIQNSQKSSLRSENSSVQTSLKKFRVTGTNKTKTPVVTTSSKHIATKRFPKELLDSARSKRSNEKLVKSEAEVTIQLAT